MPHADRHATAGTARRRNVTRVGALLGCALLLAGCASMPDSSDIAKVGEEPRTDSDPQVRVFGLQPQKDEQPKEIVNGFLEAVTSDEANYQTARNYLVHPAEWDPFSGITVVSGAPQLTALHTGANRNDTGVSIVLAAPRIAVVDRKHSYTPMSGTYSDSFHLSQVNGEWRIDTLPRGLVLSQSNFDRIYWSVNMYYFARLEPETDDAPLDTHVLVADPVYVRRRIDPVTSSVQALLSGPSTWLHPVVDSAFPAGARLPVGTKLALDEGEKLRVPLDGLPAHLTDESCDRMAAQLLDTVQDQSSTQVNSVEVTGADGSSVCTLGHQQALAYAPARVTGRGADQYFVDAHHRMESVPANAENPDPQPVSGPFGAPQAGLKYVAVSRNEQQAAAVKTNGRSLYVAQLSGTDPERQVVTSTVGLTAPSWDGLGNLWVADKNPAGPALVMWRDDRRTDVAVHGLGTGRIQAVRVAADGVRVALLVRRGDHTVLQLGRVERAGTADHPQVSVTQLRTVTPGLEDVEAASWAGESRLIVVGKQWPGVQQLQYVDTDGSAAFTPTLPGISTVSGVAAFEDQSRPLLVASGNGMFRLPRDADWGLVSSNGTGPVYPG